MDLKRTIAAVGGKAKRITVIMPLLYGGRQHRRSARENLDCALMLQELNRMGVNNIITFDAHDPRVVNAIPEGGFESVMPSYQIFKALLKRRKDLKLDKDHLMIVSPTRVRLIATSSMPPSSAWTWACSTSAVITLASSTAAIPLLPTSTWAGSQRQGRVRCGRYSVLRRIHD